MKKRMVNNLAVVATKNEIALEYESEKTNVAKSNNRMKRGRLVKLIAGIKQKIKYLMT